MQLWVLGVSRKGTHSRRLESHSRRQEQNRQPVLRAYKFYSLKPRVHHPICVNDLWGVGPRFHHDVQTVQHILMLPFPQAAVVPRASNARSGAVLDALLDQLWWHGIIGVVCAHRVRSNAFKMTSKMPGPCCLQK